MSVGRAAWSRVAWAVACAAAAVLAPAAWAEEPLALGAVVQRAIAYDLQVKAAQARLDALVRRPADAAEPARNRRAEAFPTNRPTPPAPAAAPEAGRGAIESAERELRRARDEVAARTAVAALELQRQDALVAVAKRRLEDVQRLAQRPAEPSRRGKPQPVASGELDAARRRAEAALVDAQAARLSAVDRLESIAGHLAIGVAPFDWPATAQPNPVGDEALARERAEQVARQLREATRPRPAAAGAGPRGVAQALQAREAVGELEVRAVDAGHDLALARFNEQRRLGTWQQVLADAPAATAVAAVEAPVATASSATSVEPAPTAAAADAAAQAAFAHWAESWRRKNVEAYLASYASDFAPAGLSRDAWRAQRAARLSRPGPIAVTIERPRWQRTAADTLEVRFFQRYRSPSHADAADKRIVWRLVAGGWRIVEETSRVEVSEREVRRKPG